jgi:biotin synthase-like enzyme
MGQPLADWESFCRTLVATRDTVSRDEAVTAWYPVLNKPLDQDPGGDGDFSGVEVLRAIALGRLVLPPEIEVWAPLATLGPKLAQVALEFGASHLGYVAFDGQPPVDPLVADSAMFDELLGSISRTEINAPADPASEER